MVSVSGLVSISLKIGGQCYYKLSAGFLLKKTDDFLTNVAVSLTLLKSLYLNDMHFFYHFIFALFSFLSNMDIYLARYTAVSVP